MKDFDREISLIILYKDDRILLQKKSGDYPDIPNHWAFFGGGIGRDETPEEALRRETFEELEYELENPRQAAVFDFNWKGGKRRAYVFVDEYNPKKGLVLNEGQAIGWFTIEEAKKLKMIESDKEILGILSKYLMARH